MHHERTRIHSYCQTLIYLIKLSNFVKLGVSGFYIYSPVQNLGSSVLSPQSSIPSQYLSGEMHLLLRHVNCDIRQV